MALTLSNGTQVDPQTLVGNTPPDPAAFKLMQVIQKLEGGDYQNRSGDSGASAGAFQWNNDNKPLRPGEMPSHWKNAAGQFLHDANAPMTPENQNFVAYQQIKTWKDQGLSPEDIDALWNGAVIDPTTKKISHVNPKREQAFRSLVLGQAPTTGVRPPVPSAGSGLGALQQAPAPYTVPPPSGPLPPLPSPSPKQGFWQPLMTAAKEEVSGAAKGLLSTLGGTSELGQKIFNPLVNLFGIHTQPAVNPIPEAARTPTTTGEKIGYYGEQLGELMLPSTVLGKAEAAVNTAIDGSSLLEAAGRVGAKALLQGGVSALQTGMQTGGNAEAMKTAGLVSGGLRAATGTLGELATTYHIPERIYNTFFKDNAKDMLSELNSQVLSDMPTKDPEKYQALVKAGIIKTSDSGQVYVDESLAKQALDKGLRGSITNMAHSVINSGYDNELAARQIANNYEGTIVLHPNVQKTLDTIAAAYKDVGTGEFGTKAAALAEAVRAGSGEVDAATALDIRRLLDGMRIESSFNPSPTLSLQSRGLKELADSIRGDLNDIPGMGAVMKDYTFNIEAATALAKEAARRGNNQIISLIDTALFGGGIISGNPEAGAVIGLGRRALTNAPSATAIAQGLYKGGTTGGVLPRLFGTVAGRGINGQLPQ